MFVSIEYTQCIMHIIYVYVYIPRYVYINIYNNFWYLICICFLMPCRVLWCTFLTCFPLSLIFPDLWLDVHPYLEAWHIFPLIQSQFASKSSLYNQCHNENVCLFPLKTCVFESGVLSLGFRVCGYWFTLKFARLFTNLIANFYQQCKRLLVFPNPCQYVMVASFLIFALWI